jgi:hypothetical protein
MKQERPTLAELIAYSADTVEITNQEGVTDKTPEQYWEELYNDIYKDILPAHVYDLMILGFKESSTEAEKWMRLHFMAATVLKFQIDKQYEADRLYT